jgi:hypothetical protein
MIALVCALALPLTGLYAVAGVPLLRWLFAVHVSAAATGAALPLVCLAMTLLAVSYLIVQYLLALGRRSFAAPLLLAAGGESVAVLLAGRSFQHVALALVGVQALLLAALLLTALQVPKPQPILGEEAVLV